MRLPVNSTVLYSFLLYYFNVSGIWWGVFITLMTLLWVVIIVSRYHSIEVDLDSAVDPTYNNEVKAAVKSQFQIKLEELKKKNGW